MDIIKRMVCKALKNDKFAEAVKEQFTLGLILSFNRDWDWGYEDSKIRFIHSLIDSRDKYSYGALKKAYKDQMKQTPYLWYDEYKNQARHILRTWRKPRGIPLI